MLTKIITSVLAMTATLLGAVAATPIAASADKRDEQAALKSGRVTYYNPGTGACGQTHTDADFVPPAPSGEDYRRGSPVAISYSDSKLDKASNVIAVIVASTMPVLTIFVLNSVQSTTGRIGWTVLFTVLFAGFLALFSSAKRAELFAATATSAAVEVVFIGSAISSTSGAG